MNNCTRYDLGLLVGVGGIALFVLGLFMAMALLAREDRHPTSQLRLPSVDIARGY